MKQRGATGKLFGGEVAEQSSNDRTGRESRGLGYRADRQYSGCSSGTHRLQQLAAAQFLHRKLLDCTDGPSY
ncbi:MAG: hypothetical protein ACWGPN_09205 [Gammaproteobacteria bacterium]